MKKVLIIGRRHPGEKNDAARLAEGLKTHLAGGSLLEWAHWEDIVIRIQKSGRVVEIIKDEKCGRLQDFNLVIAMGWTHDRLYSDVAYTIALQAQENSVEIWNSELLRARSMTKVSQIFNAAQAGIDVPETIFSLDMAKARQANFLELPLIAKDPTASRGRRNFLVSDAKELEGLVAKTRQPLMLQEYIESDASDIRIIMAGGRPVLAFRRVGKPGSHLHNTSTGATAELQAIDKLPASLKQASEKICKLFDRELCGIDFIFDKVSGRHIFLEVNSMPQLSSGVFLNEKFKALAKAVGE